ncbi:MAG: deoxyribodipyrimidine photo-lyase [Flavobacteriaceae bacterium]
MKESTAIFWFRRDLRLHDNRGFHAALSSGETVLPIFIFDREILQGLRPNDPRVSFIHKTLQNIRHTLESRSRGSIAVYYGRPLEIFRSLTSRYNVRAVYANKDYEPYALERDKKIGDFLRSENIELQLFKDQVIFEEDEITKDNGDPYVVYTPYKNKWKSEFDLETALRSFPSDDYFDKLISSQALPWKDLQDMGFESSSITVPAFNWSSKLLENYEATRNFPALDEGTSRIGPHLRFGTVSIREIMLKAIHQKNETYWNELIWREFFSQILWHFPKTMNNSFKPQYDRIKWRNNEVEFEAWKTGNTGYPLVDAGMRELNTTGYMHNRVRMLVASFLCKHLLIDWRWGEAYFAEKLLDFELSSNIGNWQWAAGSGVDAAPYFRIFNPYTQADKFDKNREYIAKWVPEYQSKDYSAPIVEHKFARERCLETYKEALKS